MKVDKSHFRECLLEMLSDMFGGECVNPLIRKDIMTMMVDKRTVLINLSDLVSGNGLVQRFPATLSSLFYYTAITIGTLLSCYEKENNNITIGWDLDLLSAMNSSI